MSALYGGPFSLSVHKFHLRKHLIDLVEIRYTELCEMTFTFVHISLI
jgi:hypothetical protein